MNEAIKKCKTSAELFRAVNRYFNSKNIDDKWSNLLQRRLKAEKDYNKSLQMVYDYILNSEHPMKKERTAYVPYKGSAIGGMECHSPRS